MTDDLVDQRKIATELSQRAIDYILTLGGKTVKNYWARYKNRDVTTYADYLIRKGVQANAVRNFIYDFRSASLYDIYVPAKIEVHGDDTHIGTYTGDDFLRWLCKPVDDPRKRPTRASAVIGGAGTGKSLFLKHAFFKIQDINANQIPVLIEVRNFNKVLLADLETRIYEVFEATGTKVFPEQISNGLKSGLFVVLLDGMDELKGVIQEHYEAELIGFVRKFPLCPVIVSTRPTRRIYSWREIIACDILPLNLTTAVDLVKRLEFDEKVKTGFIKLLRKDLFRTHVEFVSIPLLCTIMLLTYSDSGYISNNRHEFFEDAFTALWSKHDGRKDGFERHRYTGLQKNEFLKLLSAFAISSYNNADYNMKDAQFHHHFETAIRLSGATCREEDFLQDLTTSTSLALQDGPYVRFCHRAFQEYFSALFICEMSDSFTERLIEEISDRMETDNVLPLVLSINDEKIEKHWSLPRVKMVSEFVEAAYGDIDGYARAVVGEVPRSRMDISNTMHKIRTLYQFDPGFDRLRPAYDAARAMKIRVRRLMEKKGSNIFEQDRKNFLNLRERLMAKYERKASALDQLLNRAELETGIKSEPVKRAV
jgi:hypothetical protein